MTTAGRLDTAANVQRELDTLETYYRARKKYLRALRRVLKGEEAGPPIACPTELDEVLAMGSDP